jgi:hypothetical protein
MKYLFSIIVEKQLKTWNENMPKNCLKLKTELNPKNSMTFKVRKSISDEKIFSEQTVLLKRLSPQIIQKYDKNFYKKHSKQLKSQKAFNQYSKVKQNSQKWNESPQRMRLWQTISPLKVSTNYALTRNSSQFNRSLNFDEPESSIMNSSQYCRYLNLISVKELNRKPFNELKPYFNIRNIAKSENVDKNQKLLINDTILINNMLNKFQVFIHLFYLFLL